MEWVIGLFRENTTGVDTVANQDRASSKFSSALNFIFQKNHLSWFSTQQHKIDNEGQNTKEERTLRRFLDTIKQKAQKNTKLALVGVVVVIRENQVSVFWWFNTAGWVCTLYANLDDYFDSPLLLWGIFVIIFCRNLLYVAFSQSIISGEEAYSKSNLGAIYGWAANKTRNSHRQDANNWELFRRLKTKGCSLIMIGSRIIYFCSLKWNLRWEH